MTAVVNVQSNRFANAENISQFLLIPIGFAYNDNDDNYEDDDDNDDQKEEQLR